MRALTIHEYGAPDVFKVEEIEKPKPGSHQVLIEVKNSSINPVDWKIRAGHLSLLIPKHWPRVLGVDCSGIVAEVGDSVRSFAPGDAVFGMSNPLRSQYGAYAQYCICDKDSITKKPDGLSFSDAASIPVAALTAYKAFKLQIKLQPGQKVLINGASGGVGSFAVQIAKAMGAKITATCSADNIEFVRSLGADEVVDYKEQDIRTLSEKFDGIFDASAKLNFAAATRMLTKHGVYVTTVPDPFTVLGLLTSILGGKKAYIVSAGSGAFVSQELSAIAEMVLSGQVKPIIAKSVSLEEVPDSQKFSEAGHARGKTVIDI
ncbi:MAG: NAD(P)-dependent alcohol dehydrogenase [Cyanobacteria bacterium SZAS-4]|nr:NAD(P)-dependent alcohol dehydrogenase [Cyanobacteria bacterium SZAS-4]